MTALAPMSPPPLLIFTHIPKAAGSTLAAVLRTQYGRAQTLDVTPLTDAERVKRMEDFPVSTRLVIGHARFGLHRHTSRECRYFTLLRDPVERVISALHYIRRTPEHHLHAQFAGGVAGLGELAPLQRDIQTKFIAGTPPRTEAGPGDLEQAKANLEQYYAVAGLAEFFDESLLLLAEAFGWAQTTSTARNVTRDRPARQACSDAELAAVRDANQLDQQLYDFVQARLRERLAAQPPSFQQNLEAFRRRLQRQARRREFWGRLRGWLGGARARSYPA
jgi:hypothetical protein